jgi:hypothetical protein
MPIGGRNVNPERPHLPGGNHAGRMIAGSERAGTLSAGGRTPGEFDGAVAGVRQLAAAYGLTPVVQLADALERAGRRDGPGSCTRALYLDRLQDAIGCTRLDQAAGEALIASVTVRFAG